MLDGKKSIAQKSFMMHLKSYKKKQQTSPLEVFENALNNVMPVL